MLVTQEVPDLPVYGFTPNLGGLLGVVLLVALPVLVGLITKQSTSGAVKGLLLLAVAAVKVFFEAWLEAVNAGTDFLFVPLIYTILINFVIAVAVHFGLFKPTGLAAGAQKTMIHD